MAKRKAKDPAAEEQSRERILKVALKEFAEKGFAGARMQSIADSAEINKAMLHYYFRNKEGLYYECLKSFIVHFRQQMGAALLNAEGLDQLVEGATDTFFNYHKANPDFIRILLREVLNDLQGIERVFAENMKAESKGFKLFEIFFKKVAALQADGHVRRDLEPLQVLLSIMGALASSMVQARTFAPRLNIDLDRFLDERADATKKIMIAGLKPQD